MADPLFQKFGREFPKGTSLFREGEPGREMYVVQSGKIAITKKVRDVEKILGILGPGEFFGEMSILANKPRTANAVVHEDAKLLVIDSKTFEAMIRGNTEIAVRMIKKLVERLTEADEQIEYLMLRDPNSRVANYLLRKAAKSGAPNPVQLDLDLKTLDTALGLRSDQVDTAVQKMAKAGMIDIQGETVVVPDVGKLRQFLEFLEMKEKFGDMV